MQQIKSFRRQLHRPKKLTFAPLEHFNTLDRVSARSAPKHVSFRVLMWLPRNIASL